MEAGGVMRRRIAALAHMGKNMAALDKDWRQESRNLAAKRQYGVEGALFSTQGICRGDQGSQGLEAPVAQSRSAAGL